MIFEVIGTRSAKLSLTQPDSFMFSSSRRILGVYHTYDEAEAAVLDGKFENVNYPALLIIANQSDTGSELKENVPTADITDIFVRTDIRFRRYPNLRRGILTIGEGF